MRIAIIGNGEFGNFLKDVLSKHCIIDDNADTVILAIPLSAYKEVCEKNSGKHFVNVCSVQAESNKICKQFSYRVTGVHPLFGPNSKTGSCVVTHKCAQSDAVLEVFSKISVIVENYNGEPITDDLHDTMMWHTHLQLAQLTEQIERVVKQAEWIPDECLPASFLQLKKFSETFFKVSEGTRDSISSNKSSSS